MREIKMLLRGKRQYREEFSAEKLLAAVIPDPSPIMAAVRI